MASVSRPKPKTDQTFWTGHLGITLILLAYLGVGLLYSATTPILEASDELWHFPFVKHLADGGGLPVQDPAQPGPWRQEGSQPPLYYALGALLIRGIDTSDMAQVRWLNPHADIGVLTQDRNVNMIVHTAAERFPFRGTVLAIHVVRWFSLLLGAITVLAGYLLALELFPHDRLVGNVAAALTAFNPMALFISASVNNDALVMALCAVILWLLAKYVVMKPSIIQWAFFGVLLGLASLSKASALGLFPLVATIVVINALNRRSWRDLLRCGLAIGLPVLVIGGWWYYRNWRLYGEPLGLATFVAFVGPRNPKPTLTQLLGEWKGFVMSYWGFFGGVNVAAPSWVYWALSLSALVSLPGIPLYLWRLGRSGGLLLRHRLQLAVVGLWPVVVFIALIRWTMMTIASQGRLMFSALAALSLLMAMGLVGLVPRRGRSVLSSAISAAMLGIAIWLPFGVIRPAYAAPPILRQSDLPASLNRLQAEFGTEMRLLGYLCEAQSATPGGTLRVTLYWQSLAPMQRNYSVFVHLLGTNEITIGQRDLYPGQGNYPTTLWSPGDIIADSYVIPISPTALTPDQAELEVGLYVLETGQRLAAKVLSDPSGSGVSVVNDALRFGRIVLPERTLDGIPNPTVLNLGDEIALVGYRLDRTAAAPGQSFRLTLFWRALRDIQTNYTVFTHVLGERDHLWAQKDSWPRSGRSPTSGWRKGQVIEDTYKLRVADDAPAGVFDIEIGMYAEGKRLSVLDEGGRAIDTRILLTKVRILPLAQAVGPQSP